MTAILATLTQTGLNQLASAITGGYVPPLYLVIDTTQTTMPGGCNINASSITTAARVDQAGDTQLILGLGAGSQEVVTFTGVTGTGPYVYTLSGTTAAAHTNTAIVTRVPLVTDTMANVLGEVGYDPVNAPGTRAQVPSGYAPGVGQWVSAFYLTAAQAQVVITLCGMSDSPTIGQGNLHAYWAMGFDHTPGNRDLEIDALLTLA